MSNHENSEEEGEEEEEGNVQDPINKDTTSTPREKSDSNLPEKLTKNLQQSLKIAVTHEPPDIGPSPYKVAVVG